MTAVFLTLWLASHGAATADENTAAARIKAYVSQYDFDIDHFHQRISFESFDPYVVQMEWLEIEPTIRRIVQEELGLGNQPEVEIVFLKATGAAGNDKYTTVCFENPPDPRVRRVLSRVFEIGDDKFIAFADRPVQQTALVSSDRIKQKYRAGDKINLIAVFLAYEELLLKDEGPLKPYHLGVQSRRARDGFVMITAWQSYKNYKKLRYFWRIRITFSKADDALERQDLYNLHVVVDLGRQTASMSGPKVIGNTDMGDVVERIPASQSVGIENGTKLSSNRTVTYVFMNLAGSPVKVIAHASTVDPVQVSSIGTLSRIVMEECLKKIFD